MCSCSFGGVAANSSGAALTREGERLKPVVALLILVLIE